jgi:hypothetical protein
MMNVPSNPLMRIAALPHPHSPKDNAEAVRDNADRVSGARIKNRAIVGAITRPDRLEQLPQRPSTSPRSDFKPRSKMRASSRWLKRSKQARVNCGRADAGVTDAAVVAGEARVAIGRPNQKR